MTKQRVLLVGSSLKVKGGIVSVLKNYVNYEDWNETEIFYVPTHKETNVLGKVIYFLCGILRIIYTCFVKKIDIVHIHVSERGSFFRKALITRICKRLEKKVILHHHGAEFKEFYQQLSDKKKAYVSKILEMVDLNIVLSNRLIPMITNINEKAKVQVLYNAVHTYSKNPYNKDANKVLFLGRLGERKGTYDLLEAINNLDSNLDPSVMFYLCGDGEVETVNKKIDELDIRNRIAHVGWVEKDKKEEYMRNSMINVLPSYNEGLPMTILETMAYGIPNIATNIASIPEVITEGETGFMVEPGDIQALTDRLEEVINDNELRLTISQSSYKFISNHFALKQHIKKLERIYGSI